VHASVLASDRNGQLVDPDAARHHVSVSIDDRDVTTVMAILGDIREDVREIRRLLEDGDDGEEEATPEDHS